MKSVILFGASGQQGTAIAKHLINEGYAVIAPVRSQKSVEILSAQGITARLSDFSVPSLTDLVRQADKVVLQVPVVITPSEMVEFAENALKAIVQAGAPNTVFVISSVIPSDYTGKQGPDARLTMKNLAMQYLPDSIVLSSTLYLENFSQAYRQAIEQGGVIPQAILPDLPVAYLSFADLASYVLAALNKPELKGSVIPIRGSESLTGVQLAEKLGALLGRHIHYQAITPQELAVILTPIIGETTAQQVAEMYEWEGSFESSLLNPNLEQVKALLEVSLPSFEQWAAKAFQISITA